MIKVNAITCPRCKDTIYSRAHHDFRSCSCGDTFVDGGFDYVRIGGKNLGALVSRKIEVNATKKQLYDDWNKSIDKFGLVKGKCPSLIGKPTVIIIGETKSIKRDIKSGKPKVVSKGKKKNLFAQFLDAIFADAKKHPEKLHTSDEVWDEEWTKLLNRPAKEIPKLKKLFKGYNKRKKDSKLIESIKRGIMDLKKGKYVAVKDLDKFFKEL